MRVKLKKNTKAESNRQDRHNDAKPHAAPPHAGLTVAPASAIERPIELSLQLQRPLCKAAGRLRSLRANLSATGGSIICESVNTDEPHSLLVLE